MPKGQKTTEPVRTRKKREDGRKMIGHQGAVAGDLVTQEEREAIFKYADMPGHQMQAGAAEYRRRWEAFQRGELTVWG